MKVTFNVRLDESIKDRLREIASRNHRSMTRQIEYWIEMEKSEEDIINLIRGKL